MSKLATLHLTILLLSSCLVLSLPLTPSKLQSSCGAVHILAARGSYTPQGPGLLAPLVDQIKTRLNPMTTVTSEAILWGQETTVTSESIRYSAVFDPTSTAEGTEAVKSQLIDAASRCPTSKIVILGFSQGALIVGDALGGGGGGPMGPRTPGMNESFIREHISAVALFGDPRHNVADQFNRGTATSGGWYPRDAEAVAKLNEIKDLMVGYCDFNDSFCASGEDLPLHVGCVERHRNEATEFVAGKVESFPFPTM